MTTTKLYAPFYRFQWLGLSGAMLIALLQRTPVVRVVAAVEACIVGSPVGAIVRSAFLAASLGALHSRAGATTFSQNPTNPVQGTVGTSLSVAFTYTGTPSAPARFTFAGTLPPGLAFTPQPTGNTIPSGTPSITGIPTQAGSFSITVQGFNADGLTNGVQQQINFEITGGATATAPSFTTHPQSQTVNAGANVTFTSEASGTPTPTYQWRKDGANLAGATQASLTLTNVTATNAGTYSVVATNSAGSATSNNATLTVQTANPGGPLPTITGQPLSVTAIAQQKVAFLVSATGTGLTYQWKTSTGGAIPGATQPLLVLPSVTAADAGSYFCTVTNGGGSVDTAHATLTLAAPGTSPGYLRALSLRGNVGSGADVFFVGFVLEGSGGQVLTKAIGPGIAAAPHNVPGAMVDPQINLIVAGTNQPLGNNDNWGGTAELLAANAATGSFPMTNSSSRDAALLQTLPSGVYIATVSGVNNGTGVCLVEFYGTGVPANLRALSLRGRIGVGADVFFIGFVVDGPTSKTVLIKAIGPGIAAAPHNVPGAMADPQLELSVAGSNVFLGANDNWGGAQALVEANVSAGAFPMTDPSSRDAILLVTLPPGVYIATARGAANTAGVALVEFYGL